MATGIVATFLMTAFVYAVSLLFGGKIRLVSLLGDMVTAAPPGPQVLPRSYIAGIVLHYGIGCFFMLVYRQLWVDGIAQPDLKGCILLGAGTGVAAVLFWRLYLYLHARPPRLLQPLFYSLIFLGHVVFGIIVCILLSLLHS